MDGCSRQNPAYRSATERAPSRGSFYSNDVPPQPGLTDEGRSYPGSPPTCHHANLEVCRSDLFEVDRRLVFRRRGWEHVFDQMIVCILIPRFELAVAAGGREALAAGPVAL